jgi:hypothetical protein
MGGASLSLYKIASGDIVAGACLALPALATFLQQPLTSRHFCLGTYHRKSCLARNVLSRYDTAGRSRNADSTFLLRLID